MGARRLPSWLLSSPLPGVVLVLLVGLAVRLPYLSARSIWFDEASSWRAASLPFSEMLQSVRQNVHAPLYYVLLKSWMTGFGDSAAALRSLSVLLGTATVLGMYLFGREVYAANRWNQSPKEQTGVSRGPGNEHWFGLLLASLVALSPFQIDASIETKMYSLGTALAAFSSWLLLRALRAGRTSPLWELYALTLLAFLYTHHYALLSIAAQLGWLGMLLAWRALRDSGAEVVRLVRRLAVPGILVAVAYLPWALALREQTARVQREYWTQPVTWETVKTTVERMMFSAEDFTLPFRVDPVLAAVLLVVAAAAWRLRPGSVLVVLSATVPLALAALISHLYTPIWAPRYFRFAQLFLLAAAAIAIWRIPLGWLRVLAGCLTIGLLAGLTIDYWAERDIAHRPGMRGVMERIQAENRDNAPIIVIRPAHYFPARYYAPTGTEVRLLASDSPLLHYQGGPIVLSEDFISPEEVQARLATGVWIISPSPFGHVPGLESCQVWASFQVHYDRPVHSPIFAAYYRKVQPPEP